jgi:hypothetical protein
MLLIFFTSILYVGFNVTGFFDGVDASVFEADLQDTVESLFL